ncbi:hypothetical protein B0H10DRAFT_2226022 [Mycena sp. CBHHK59/15]|nr:hypothetical protein B0H10DRAFT_2226022 [Mycena sp. CBHHK59/15]
MRKHLIEKTIVKPYSIDLPLSTAPSTAENLKPMEIEEPVINSLGPHDEEPGESMDIDNGSELHIDDKNPGTINVNLDLEDDEEPEWLGISPLEIGTGAAFYDALEKGPFDTEDWTIVVLVKDCTRNARNAATQFAIGVDIPLDLYGPEDSTSCMEFSLFAQATDVVSQLQESEFCPTSPWDLFWCLPGFPWLIGPFARRHNDQEDVQMDSSQQMFREIPVTGSEDALRLMVVFKHPNDKDCGVPGLVDSLDDVEQPAHINHITPYGGPDAIKEEEEDIKPKVRHTKVSTATQDKNHKIDLPMRPTNESRERSPKRARRMTNKFDGLAFHSAPARFTPPVPKACVKTGADYRIRSSRSVISASPPRSRSVLVAAPLPSRSASCVRLRAWLESALLPTEKDNVEDTGAGTHLRLRSPSFFLPFLQCRCGVERARWNVGCPADIPPLAAVHIPWPRICVACCVCGYTGRRQRSWDVGWDEDEYGNGNGGWATQLQAMLPALNIWMPRLMSSKMRFWFFNISSPRIPLAQPQESAAHSVISEAGDLVAASPLMYGMPISGVEPLEPGVREFVWEKEEYAFTNGDELLPQVHSPAPSQPAPENCCYPQALEFHLETNLGYRRTKVYWSDFYIIQKPLIRRRLLCTINPPDIEATFDVNGMFIQKPLPGMTRQIMGIPYIQRIDGNSHHTVTVAVAQTNESLKRFGNGISERVEELERELYLLAFGSNPNCPAEESITALYNLGLKRNDRSSKPAPGSSSNDGSYSLASTVEKGQGQGCFQPAVQTSTPAAQKLIRRTLVIVHELQQLIMPCCLSKFEWEMFHFMADDNNVFVFGGLGPGATGLQMNVYSGTGNLELSIGSLQGKWHTDVSDAPPFWTFGILLLKLPPGSDPGPFMFGRCGLYVRETGILIIYLIFRGNDLHSGFHPSYIGSVHEAWIDKEAVLAAYNMTAPEKRIFLVPYPTEVGYSRAAELAVTPPLTFMNMGAPVLHKLHTRNFSQHGETILGSSHDRHTRLSREIIWASLNALKFAGITLDMKTADLFSKLKYTDENGEVCTVGPPPFDIDLSNKYLIRLTKDMYQTVQACIKFQQQLKEEIFSSVEQRSVQSLLSGLHLGEPAHVITDIVGRELVGGEIVWKVRVQDEATLMVVSKTETEWLYQSPNRLMLAEFIKHHIPLTSPALRKMYERMIVGEQLVLVPEPAASTGDKGSDNPATLPVLPEEPDMQSDLDKSLEPKPLFLQDDDDPPDDFLQMVADGNINDFLLTLGGGPDMDSDSCADEMDVDDQDEICSKDEMADNEQDNIRSTKDFVLDNEDELVEEHWMADNEQEDIGSTKDAVSEDEEDELAEEHGDEEMTYEIAGIIEYSNDEPTHGTSALNTAFPNFALLTDHVMLYVKHVQKEAVVKANCPPKKKPKKSAKKGRTVIAEEPSTEEIPEAHVASTSNSLDPPVILTSGLPWPPPVLQEVPADLYGLQAVSARKKASMPQLTNVFLNCCVVSLFGFRWLL